jgi:hypothetical protein
LAGHVTRLRKTFNCPEPIDEAVRTGTRVVHHSCFRWLEIFQPIESIRS